MAVFSDLACLAVSGVCAQVFPGVSGTTGEEVTAGTPLPALSSTTRRTSPPRRAFLHGVRRAWVSVVIVFVLSVHVARATPEQYPCRLCRTLRVEMSKTPQSFVGNAVVTLLLAPFLHNLLSMF